MPDVAAAAPGHPALGGIRLVFGGNVFGWTLDRDRSFAVLDAFFECGGRMIDTAEGYSAWIPGNRGGESETIIGKWLESRGVRAEMRIHTKTGMGGPPGAYEPARVEAALKGSLDRLRTDHVDLYYAHRDDTTATPESIAAVFASLHRRGLARALGVSNTAPDRLAAMLDAADAACHEPFTICQPQYNLVARNEFEGELQALCLARGVAALPYYGLASGFLTGKFASPADWTGSARAPALAAAAAGNGWATLAAMREIAQEIGPETGATLAAIALAWVISRPGIGAPLASATSPAQVREICAGATLALTPAQLARLENP